MPPAHIAQAWQGSTWQYERLAWPCSMGLKHKAQAAQQQQRRDFQDLAQQQLPAALGASGS